MKNLIKVRAHSALCAAAVGSEKHIFEEGPRSLASESGSWVKCPNNYTAPHTHTHTSESFGNFSQALKEETFT